VNFLGNPGKHATRKWRMAEVKKVRKEAKELSPQEQRLVDRGIVVPPLKERPARSSWPEPPGDVADEVMEQVWREERDG
jgi:hypothetical protein